MYDFLSTCSPCYPILIASREMRRLVIPLNSKGRPEQRTIANQWKPGELESVLRRLSEMQ